MLVSTSQQHHLPSPLLNQVAAAWMILALRIVCWLSPLIAWRLKVWDEGGGRFDAQRGPAPWFVDGHLLAVFIPEEALVLSSSHQGSDRIMGALPPWLYPNLNTSQRYCLQTPSHWELGLQHRSFRGTVDIQSLTFALTWRWRQRGSWLIFMLPLPPHTSAPIAPGWPPGGWSTSGCDSVNVPCTILCVIIFPVQSFFFPWSWQSHFLLNRLSLLYPRLSPSHGKLSSGNLSSPWSQGYSSWASLGLPPPWSPFFRPLCWSEIFPFCHLLPCFMGTHHFTDSWKKVCGTWTFKRIPIFSSCWFPQVNMLPHLLSPPLSAPLPCV